MQDAPVSAPGVRSSFQAKHSPSRRSALRVDRARRPLQAAQRHAEGYHQPSASSPLAAVGAGFGSGSSSATSNNTGPSTAASIVNTFAAPILHLTTIVPAIPTLSHSSPRMSGSRCCPSMIATCYPDWPAAR